MRKSKYKIVLRKQAQKELSRIPETFRNRILNAIESLQSNPWRGKRMKGEFTGYFSLVIKPYRVIYAVDNKQIIIIPICN